MKSVVGRLVAFVPGAMVCALLGTGTGTAHAGKVECGPTHSCSVEAPVDAKTLAVLDAEPHDRAIIALKTGGDRDLAALTKLTWLTGLSILSDDVTDLSRVAQLKQLRQLTVGSRKVTSIAALADLPALENLNLGASHVADLSPLRGAHKLWQLVGNEDIKDLTPIAGMTQLRSLWLQQSKLTDWAPLATLTGLETLHAEASTIDVKTLRNLKHLGFLYLYDCGVTDLGFLSGLTELKELDLSGNSALSDISAVAKLKNLQELWIKDTPAAKKLGALKKSSPDLVVHVDDN